MKSINRRQFVHYAAASFAGATLIREEPLFAKAESPAKMTTCLSGGAVGVSGNQREIIDLAAKYGFGSVEAHGSYLASLNEEQMAGLKADMKSKGVSFGFGALTVEFRKDDAAFGTGMKALPEIAAGFKRAGVSRMTTWIMPCHDTITYQVNFKQHARRLREAAILLKDNGIHLGLEYVGPKTLWSSKRYTFIHSMAETKDLILEIGTGNIGFLLDTYHWWTAGESEEDLLSLKNSDIVSVDLNDGVAGLTRDQAVDNRRELPCKTGVIDTAIFINALNRIGYDGPMRAEPFNREVNALGKEGACAATIESLRKALALIK